MIKPGDRVRIRWGQNRGKTGVYLHDYRGRAVVQYGPSYYHITKLQYANIEKMDTGATCTAKSERMEELALGEGGRLKC